MRGGARARRAERLARKDMRPESRPRPLRPQPVFSRRYENFFRPSTLCSRSIADAVLAQELVADDPAELEPEQRARRVQVQHDHREVRVVDRVERQVDARHQERVLVPARRSEHLQARSAAPARAGSRLGAVAWLIEITSPPVSTTKFAGCLPSTSAAHRRQPVHPQRQLEVERLRRQVLAERDLARLVVDDHREAERQRRQALRLLHRQVAQRRILDQARHVAQLERSELERVDPRQLQAAQADVADAGAERVGDRRDAEPLRGRAATGWCSRRRCRRRNPGTTRR